MFDGRDRLAASPAHALALDCLEAGIAAARPGRAVDRHCSVEDETLWIRDTAYDLSAYESVVVVGGGKAADGLAAALEALLDGVCSVDGAVVTHEPTAATDTIEIHEGDHPTPGEASLAGTSAILERVAAADERTFVLATVTGGGSTLLCAPAEGLSVGDLRAVTDGLLAAGAPVAEVNAVRRACSRIKGGGLAAAAAPATVVGVLVSDVVDDDLATIASGPTASVDTDPDAALAVLDRYGVSAPTVRPWLQDADLEPAPDVRVDNHVVGSSRDAVDAARHAAAEQGYDVCILSTRIEGEAEQAGRFHAAIAAEAVDGDGPIDTPGVLLSAGETTVSVTGDGVGGPNLEFALAGAFDLPDRAVLGSVDTDGSDGSTDAAGALVDADTIDDFDAARAALVANDSHTFLGERRTLLRSGATGTNVNDLRVIVVGQLTRS